MKNEVNKTSDTSITPFFSPDDFSGTYAGNGNTIPTSGVTVKNRVSSRGDTIETETTIDFNHILPASLIKNAGNVGVISDEETVEQKIVELAKKLCEEHPEICIDPDMLGGMPHIKGLRLSVGNILAKLYIYGNIEKIKEIYGEDISEHQIKEAIAYAQDFLESACVSTEP